MCDELLTRNMALNPCTKQLTTNTGNGGARTWMMLPTVKRVDAGRIWHVINELLLGDQRCVPPTTT